MLAGRTPIFLGTACFCGIIYFLSLGHSYLYYKPYPDEMIWKNFELFPYGSLIIGMFAGMFLTAWVCILIARKNFTFLKYLSYQIGWGTLHGGEKSESTILNELIDAYRKEIVDLDDNQANRNLIHRTLFERTTPFWFKSTVLLIIITLILFVFDMRNFSYITKDNVVFSPYLKLSVTHYPTKDIQKIDRECYIHLDNRQPISKLNYYIILPKGEKLELTNNLDKLIETDKYLQEHIMPQRPNVRVRIFKRVKTVPATLDSCQRYLKIKDIEMKRLQKDVFNL